MLTAGCMPRSMFQPSIEENVRLNLILKMKVQFIIHIINGYQSKDSIVNCDLSKDVIVNSEQSEFSIINND